MKSKKVVTYDYDSSEIQLLLVVTAAIISFSKFFGFLVSFWERNFFVLAFVKIIAACCIVYFWNLFYSRKVSYVKEVKK